MDVKIITIIGNKKEEPHLPKPLPVPKSKVVEVQKTEEVVNVHLDSETANKVMARMKYTDKDGVLHYQPKWSAEEIDLETCHLDFPNGTTLYDKWVAYNFFYADTCRALSEEYALKAAYYFYFQDEDAPEDKLYRYLKAMGAL